MNTPLRHQITHRPDFAMLRVRLAPHERVLAEPKAMATMSRSITVKPGFRGGLRGTLGRVMGGEHIVVNTFSGGEHGGEVTFAPGPAGDMVHYNLRGHTVFLQRGAFVACQEGVAIGASFEGARGFFSGEGMILLRASGHGDLFFSSYGAILEIDVTEGYIVDTGYIVAFEDTLNYHISVLPGASARSRLKSLLLGGEGWVCRFSGQGKVWIQTRTVNPFLAWVHPYRPRRRSPG